jgi:hypothetical protein
MSSKIDETKCEEERNVIREKRYVICQLTDICNYILKSHKEYCSTSPDYYVELYELYDPDHTWEQTVGKVVEYLEVMISKFLEHRDIQKQQAVESRLALKKAAERLIISFGEGTVDIERVKEELKTIEKQKLASIEAGDW